MSNSLGEAVLDLTADSAQLEKDIEHSKGGVLNVLEGMGTLGGKILMASIAAVIAGSVVVGKALQDSVQAAADAQQVQAQLGAVLTSTGGAAGVTADQVNNLADKYSQLTMFDDEAIVSAESMLLTFTKIGSDVFPQATETVLNMSQALGQDLQSSSIQLGKALNDPINGVTALRKVGVTFTEDQEKMIKKLVETGKLEEAQGIILKELQTEFGGSAEAAGKTFAGQLAILKTNLGNIQETIGMALLPVLSDLATMLGEYLNRPETKQFIEDLAKAIGDFAAEALEKLPAFIDGIKQAFTWLQNNQGVIIGVLAALGSAVAVFLWTTISPLLPVLAVMALIGAAAYLIYTAWTENWGGIQEKMAAVWAVIQPALQEIWNWLQINIPLALQALSQFWTTVLLPAIQSVWAWVTTSLIPMLLDVWNWLQINIPLALQALSNFWTGTLLPAIQGVWGWMSGTLFPFFQQIADFMNNVFSLAVTALAGLWQNVLQPAITPVLTALQQVGDYVVATLQPIFQGLSDFITGTLIPLGLALLQGAFDGITQAITTVTEWLGTLNDKLGSIVLPAWLTPGSPTPFENGLVGIASTIGTVSSMIGTLQSSMMSISSVMQTQINMRLEAMAKDFKYVYEAGGRVEVFFKTTFKSAVTGLAQAFQKVISAVETLGDALGALASQIPPWLVPGSPTPFEIGLWGVNDALKSMANSVLPTLGGSFDANMAFAPAALRSPMTMDAATSQGNSNQMVFNFRDTTLDEAQLMRVQRRVQLIHGTG